MEDNLRDAVFQMRKWQKEYFRTKSPVVMREAIKWEKVVDGLLAEDVQPSLF